MQSRIGSAILLCLGLATIAVMVGFAFLRAVSRQDISGTSELIEGLARDAARSGLVHATEQIMADFNATSLQVGVGAAASPISPVPTHLDGPYRAPFACLADPGKLLYTQTSSPSPDDAQEENHMLWPFIRKDFDGEGSRQSSAWHCDLGLMIYEGRGRYYEPGWYDSTRPANPVADPRPVNPIRFNDLATAAADRSAPLLLDRDFARLPGVSAADRQRARYRLRYAVGVEDLQGHLLANPRAAMDVDWTNPGNDYRVIPPRLNAAGYIWFNMNQALANHPAIPLRMDHVFRGRGNASNADRAVRDPADKTWGQPAAFPWMFRSVGWKTPNQVVGWNQWWGTHTWDGFKHDQLNYNGRYDAATFDHENHGGRLYRYAGESRSVAEWPQIPMNAAGGQLLTPTSFMSQQPYVHALLGPQISWYNLWASTSGYVPSFGKGGESGDGYSSVSKAIDVVFYKSSYYLTAYSPFGRGMTGSSAANPKWYEGAVDNPWLVNALTATPFTVHQMLLGYLPPHLKTMKYTRENWYKKTGENWGIDAAGNPTMSEEYGGSTDDYVKLPPALPDTWDSSVRGLDILNDQLGSGFADFPAPSSTDNGVAIKPDYYQDNPEPRPIEQRYPGPLCRGDSTAPDQGSDDLGQYIDTDTRGIGHCTHIGKPFLRQGGSDITYYVQTEAIEPGKPYKRKWKVIRRIDPLTYKFRYSYFWDLAYGLTQALAYARATWVQYPNIAFTPSTGFSPASPRNPAVADSIEKLDRLFLRQHGENFDNPGTPCADLPVLQTVSDGNGYKQASSLFSLAGTPQHTLASLVRGEDINGNGTLDPGEDLNGNTKIDSLLDTAGGVSGAERVKVMERMLNDFRLSFFGASPAYRATFQPLDFDNDGQVQCSCYDINPDATAEELKNKTARWKQAVGGRGPAPAALGREGVDFTTGFGDNPWFCATGAFFVGKSRYYRVFVRGEVFDNQFNKPVAARTLESVVAVDPEGTIDPHDPTRPASNKPYRKVLFQRWHHNDQTTELPRRAR